MFASSPFKSCRVEHACGQRNSYACAALGTIVNPDRAPVCLYNRVHKREAEAVARRVFALHEPLERVRANLRRKPRTIIFDHQFRQPVLRT